MNATVADVMAATLKGVRARRRGPGGRPHRPRRAVPPPKLTYSQIKGFTLYASRIILSGQGAELIELAKTNLRELGAE